jgi:hypothetical protein
VVVRGDPFQSTVAPAARLLPVTTRLRLPPPCAALVTLSEESVGMGFCCRDGKPGDGRDDFPHPGTASPGQTGRSLVR